MSKPDWKLRLLGAVLITAGTLLLVLLSGLPDVPKEAERPPSRAEGEVSTAEEEKSEAAGEIDLGGPFPEVPESGETGRFSTELSDASRVEGGFSEAGREGEWVRFTKEGLVFATGTYQAGQKTGAWSSFYRATGGPLETGQFDKDQPVGNWKMYYPDGNLFESMEFVAGREHGRWTIHHPDGSVADAMTWEDGQQVGQETNYDLEGRVIAVGSFVANRPSGIWKCHDADGSARQVEAPSRRLTPREACGFGSGPDQLEGID